MVCCSITAPPSPSKTSLSHNATQTSCCTACLECTCNGVVGSSQTIEQKASLHVLHRENQDLRSDLGGACTDSDRNLNAGLNELSQLHALLDTTARHLNVDCNTSCTDGDLLGEHLCQFSSSQLSLQSLSSTLSDILLKRLFAL